MMPRAWVQGAFLLFTLLLVAFAADARRIASPWSWMVAMWMPVGWVWVGLYTLSLTFAELSGTTVVQPSVAASAPTLLVLPVVLLPPRVRKWAAVSIVGLASFIVFADRLHLRYFGSIVSLAELAMVHQVWEVRRSILALMRPGDAWLALMVLAAVIFAVWYRVPRDTRHSGRFVRIVVYGSMLLACVGGGVPAFGALRESVMMDRAKLIDTIFSYEQLANRWGVVNVHLFDVVRTVREWQFTRGRKLTPKAREKIERFLDERVPIPPSVALGYGCARGKSLLVIQVESLQAWVVDAHNSTGQEITPFLNRLRKDALFFPFLFDQTVGGRSSDAEFVVLNSLHALRPGAVSFRKASNRFVALPMLLRHAGYATLAAHANRPGFWNRGVLYPRYGFERVLFDRDLGSGETIGWGLADGAFFTRMVPELVKLPKPFFAFLVTLELHHPYDAFPERHKVLKMGELEGTRLGNYLHSMHYVDASLQSLFHDLETAGLLQDTVVAIYGDHDAGLESADPDHMQRVLALAGYAGHDPQRDPWVAITLDRVPFFVVIPGANVRGDMPVIGGHVDIAPTLLYLLGLEPPRSFIGQPLLPTGSERLALMSWGNAVSNDRIFVASGWNVPSGSCFTLASGDLVPPELCTELALRARREGQISELVVLHDLAWQIAGAQSKNSP